MGRSKKDNGLDQIIVDLLCQVTQDSLQHQASRTVSDEYNGVILAPFAQTKSFKAPSERVSFVGDVASNFFVILRIVSVQEDTRLAKGLGEVVQRPKVTVDNAILGPTIKWMSADSR